MSGRFRRTDEPLWLYLVAGALLVGGPVWNYLYLNSYPFSRPEAFVLPLVAGTLGAATAAGAYALGANLGSVVFGALLLVFLDFQFDVTAWPLSAIILAPLCIAVSLLLRARRALLTCIVLVTFNLASLPRVGRPGTVSTAAARAQSPAHAPLLVHIVLDEQWGIGGLRAAGDTALANYLTDFYLQRGFEVYEAAYSRYRETRLSIPRLVGLGTEPAVETRARMQFRLTENPYFAWLQSQGYRIHVFQSDFLDYCHSTATTVASCRVVPAVSIANIGQLPTGWPERAIIAGRFYLNVASHYYDQVRREKLAWRRSFAGRGLAQLDDARELIMTESPAGTALFAHVLLPHRPFEVDAGCHAGRRLYDAGRASLSEEAWRVRVKLYSDQVRCLHRSLGLLIAAVDRAAGNDGAIIVIHGDHGSRILSPQGNRIAQLNEQQLNSLFSTLLVVRRPGVAPALHTEPVPLQDFFGQLVRQNFEGGVNGPWIHYVMPRLQESSSADTIYLPAEGAMLWAAQPHH